MTRIALLVDSPSKRAHGNAASRLALGLVESGRRRSTWSATARTHRRRGSRRRSASTAWASTGSRGRCPVSSATCEPAPRRAGHPAGARELRGAAAAWLAAPTAVARTPPPRAGPPSGAHPREQPARQQVAREGELPVRRRAHRSVPDRAREHHRVVRADPSSGALVPNPIPKHTDLWVPSAPVAARRRAPGVRERDEPAPVQAGGPVDRRVRPRSCPSHDAQLLILGEGPGRGPADDQIRRLGLDEVAATVGWIDDLSSTSPAPGPWCTRRTRTASRRSSPRR